jgi:F0F1-type ATP synthase assembly protein I
MGLQWNEKHTIIWSILLLCIIIPFSGVFIGLLVPSLMMTNPILIRLVFIIIMSIGFVIVWKRAGQNDKKE